MNTLTQKIATNAMEEAFRRMLEKFSTDHFRYLAKAHFEQEIEDISDKKEIRHLIKAIYIIKKFYIKELNKQLKSKKH